MGAVTTDLTILHGWRSAFPVLFVFIIRGRKSFLFPNIETLMIPPQLLARKQKCV
jgi:hypothetical protein